MQRIGTRAVIGEAEIAAAAHRLADKLRSFSPTRLVFIETGGALLGRHIADVLGIPSQGIDIRYPLSRIPFPWIRRALFPAKELIYKLSSPTAPLQNALEVDPADRIVLIDDTASSGKTLLLALDHLLAFGIPRAHIRTAVLRRGRRAASVVDCFEREDKVIVRKGKGAQTASYEWTRRFC